MANTSKSQTKHQEPEEDFYSSWAEWEVKTFPKLIKKRERKELEKKPEALGIAIANEIFREMPAKLYSQKPLKD